MTIEPSQGSVAEQVGAYRSESGSSFSAADRGA